MITEQKTVVVAMSGGVDSSVAAALLVEQGYNVIGITMQLWDPEISEATGEYLGCCSLTAVNDARAVANKLGIPYYVLNFRHLFRQTVIADFCREYLSGRTPNPCIVCNRKIKFGALLSKAIALGADYLATGHYARVDFEESRGRFCLKKAGDSRKDQTYFLYNLTQEQLAKIITPLGSYTKAQVRAMAAERGLRTADKAESQEICFIPDNDYRGFLRTNVEEGRIEPGYFVDQSGKVIGRHQGIAFYTIGQRRGLGLALGERAYVTAIDPDRNTVTIGREEDLDKTGLIAKDINYVTATGPEDLARVQAKIRYNSPPVPASVVILPDGLALVEFTVPQRAIAPGQAVVFYREDYLLGGGVII